MSFYPGIITEKLAETKDFYTKNIGFTVKFENEWFAILERGGREIAFMLPELPFQNPIFRSAFEGKGVWIAVEVEDVAAEFERIKDLGVEIAVDLRTEEWGETHFSIVDPNGIGLDFVKYQSPAEA